MKFKTLNAVLLSFVMLSEQSMAIDEVYIKYEILNAVGVAVTKIGTLVMESIEYGYVREGGENRQVIMIDYPDSENPQSLQILLGSYSYWIDAVIITADEALSYAMERLNNQ